MKTNLEMMTMKPWRVALAGLTLTLVSPLTWAAAACHVCPPREVHPPRYRS